MSNQTTTPANDSTASCAGVDLATSAKTSLPVIRGFGKRQSLRKDLEPASGLLQIFSWMRPHGSEAEEEFIHEFLDKGLGTKRDIFGNRYIRVGDPSKSSTLWSSHTDTVHHQGGYQRLELSRTPSQDIFVGVFDKDGSCLGADDGTGVWLLMEMIKADIPGLYMFHRGEERGCMGSRWIAKNNPDFLKGIDRAIAFDRKDYNNVITRQAGSTCCSDQFAKALATSLGSVGNNSPYFPDPTGMYTDTNSYRDLIPECTNLSVGYTGAHGALERQNLTFALLLREKVLTLKAEELPTSRDPKYVEPLYTYRRTTYQGHNYNNNISSRVPNNNVTSISHDSRDPLTATTIGRPVTTTGRRFKGMNDCNILNDKKKSMMALIKDMPYECALIFERYAISKDDILFEAYGNDYIDHMIDDPAV